VGQIFHLHILFLDALAIHSQEAAAYRCRQDAPGHFKEIDYLMRFHLLNRA